MSEAKGEAIVEVAVQRPSIAVVPHKLRSMVVVAAMDTKVGTVVRMEPVRHLQEVIGKAATPHPVRVALLTSIIAARVAAAEIMITEITPEAPAQTDVSEHIGRKLPGPRLGLQVFTSSEWILRNKNYR